MISDETGGVHSQDILLSSERLQVIFHLTVELSLLPGDLLAKYGLRQSDVDGLVAILRPMRERVGELGNMRLGIIKKDLEGWDGIMAPNFDSTGHADKMTVEMTESMVGAWRNALESTVTSWLGERELFLRTGYSMEEAYEAIGRLRFPS
ncbi:MAG TPA: hypothetical protein VMG13_25600 [Trebonia sp.]|nr:hypothetical protein [Trebonia sp.]